MFPNRNQWREWSTLEKATYVAQIASSLALLPTVVFAYLGWSEVHDARHEQSAFFLAEKAPQIQVSRVSVLAGILMVELKNTGESVAKDVVVDAKLVNEGVRFVNLKEHLALVQPPFDIQKGQSSVYPLVALQTITNLAGYEPIRVSKSDPMESEGISNASSILVAVLYQDVQLRRQNYATSIALYRAK